jgi:uncharacterized protein (DUF433 family)
MDMTILPLEFIATDPAIRGGRPVIAGTGIRVLDIVALTIFHFKTPDEIAISYDLSLAQVHAALAYYYSHIEEVRADLDQQIDIINEARERFFHGRK